MPSRKKAKGKLRKAKAAAAPPKESQWEMYAHWAGRNVAIQCNHSSTLSWSVGDPLYLYMSAVESFQASDKNLEDGITELYETHTSVWNNTKQREMAVEILLAIGTNIILRDDDVDWASTFAIVSSVMENYEGNFNAAFYTREVRDINVGRKVRVCIFSYGFVCSIWSIDEATTSLNLTLCDCLCQPYALT